APLPARAQLLLALQGFAIKGEILVHKWGGEKGGVGVDEVPSKISLPVGQALLLEGLVQGFEEIRRVDVQRRKRRQSDLGEINIPAKLGCELVQLSTGHLVVEGFGIA